MDPAKKKRKRMNHACCSDSAMKRYEIMHVAASHCPSLWTLQRRRGKGSNHACCS